MHRISAWWLWTVKYLWKLRWVFSRLNHDSHFTIRFWEHIWNSLHGEVKFKADVQVRTDSPICLIAIHYVNHNSKVQQNNIMKKVSRSKTKHVTNCLLCLMFLMNKIWHLRTLKITKKYTWTEVIRTKYNKRLVSSCPLDHLKVSHYKNIKWTLFVKSNLISKTV